MLSYECGYNWKIVVETFMESYHHPTIHPETIEPYYPARTSYAEPGGAAGRSETRPKALAMCVPERSSRTPT